MVALLSALVGTALAQGSVDLSAPVSAEYRATRLELLLPALSKDWKVPLRCEPSLENTPLILRVDRAPLKEAMDKIAEATVATWVKMPQGWELRRDQDKLLRLSEEAREEEVRILDRELRDQVDRLSTYPMTPDSLRPVIHSAFTREEQMMKGADVKAPEGAYLHDPAVRLGHRLMRSIGARRLLDVRRAERALFATNPTAMQGSFGDGFKDAWELFKAESALFIQTRSDVAESRRPRGLEPLLKPGDPALVGRVFLVVKPVDAAMDQPLAVGSRLILYDAAGKWLRIVELAPWGAPVVRHGQLAFDGATQPIRFGEMVEELRAQFARAGGAPASLSDRLQKAFLNPETVDPLSFEVSYGLIDISKQARLNLAAVVDDAEHLLGGRVPTVGDVKPAQFLTAFRHLAPHREAAQGGWWTVRPLDPGAAESGRARRDALGTAIRGTIETRRYGLREHAVLKKESPQAPLLALIALKRLKPGEFEWAGMDPNAPLLVRLIGELEEDKWAALQRGQTLPLESFSAAQADLLRRIVMGYSDIVDSPDYPEGSQGRPYQFDATEAYPSGLPEGFTLQLDVTPEDTVFGVVKDGRSLRASRPSSIAAALYFRDHPGQDASRWPVNETLPDGFIVANNRRFTFKFLMGPGVTLSRSIMDSAAPNPKVLSYLQLPERFRTRVDQEYKAVERAYAGGAP